MNITDHTIYHIKKFELSAFQRLLCTVLVSSNYSAHLNMAGINQQLKIIHTNIVYHFDDFRWFVKDVSGLKLPDHKDTCLFCLFSALFKHFNNPVPCLPIFKISRIGGFCYCINPYYGYAAVNTHLKTFIKCFHVLLCNLAATRCKRIAP
ncbi:hypothetical protein ES703_91245 [subsurface metagenome]